MNHQKLQEIMNDIKVPVIYNDTYYWSDELPIKLRN